MRRGLLLVAGAALLALAGIGATALLRPASQPGPAEQVARLAAELRCPDCAGLSVAESRTAAATAIRAEIAELLAAGATPDQVRRHFADRYGEWILLVPPNPWLTAAPALGLGLGTAAAGAWVLSRRRRSGDAAQPGPPTDAALGRELEELDA